MHVLHEWNVVVVIDSPNQDNRLVTHKNVLLC